MKGTTRFRDGRLYSEAKVRIPEDLYEKLKAVALLTTQHNSPSTVVTRALDHLFQEERE